MRLKADSHEYQPEGHKVTIYILIDPRDGEIHYVGCSRYPNYRYSMHLSHSQGKEDSKRNQWLKELRSLGLRPIGESLIELTTNDAYWIEEETWVRRLTLAGCELYNNTKKERNIIKEAEEMRNAF